MKLSLPLLSKELLEQANRKRTYWFRGVFAFLIVLFFMLSLWDEGLTSPDKMDLWRLHRIGQNIMQMVVVCQYAAVFLLLPASSATVISSEKERYSLELLLLTDMKPWQIILQKYLSRIIPVVMFLMLTLPLLAVCYAFGGIRYDELSQMMLVLFTFIFYIGAWGVFHSSLCRNSVSAILMTYFSLGIITIAYSILIPMLAYKLFRFSFVHAIWFFAASFWIQIPFLLWAAKAFLKSRRAPKKGNPFLRILQRIDRFWKRCNTVTGGIEVIKSDEYRLPEQDPIAWYEKYKRPSGRKHYLARGWL